MKRILYIRLTVLREAVLASEINRWMSKPNKKRRHNKKARRK